MGLRIYLTGRITIEREGSLLDQDALGGRQGALVFARLLIPRGLAVSREELAAVIWEGRQPRATDVALNAIISKLRGLAVRAGLDRSSVLPATLGCYQLNLPPGAWIDVEAGFDALHAAEGLLKRGVLREAWSEAQVAYHIFKRPFLPGEQGDWPAKKRGQFSAFHVRACEGLAEAYIRNGEPSIAVQLATEALERDSLRETAHQLLMRAHAAAGNRARALEAYENCRRLISAELGVAPSSPTEAVYLEILRGQAAGRR